MLDLATTQGIFAKALFQPFAPLPATIELARERRSKSAFDIYRNNVAAGLIKALSARYPVTSRLLGESFRVAAHRYVVAEPPRSPIMLQYGTTFPRFLRELRQGASTDYLSDIAQLELARGSAYHAADARPVSAQAFARLRPEQLGSLRICPHPSASVVTSRFPVVTVWEANQLDDTSINHWGPEDALVARPFLDVEVCRLPPGGYPFFRVLLANGTLAEAVERASTEVPDFEPAANLAILIKSNVVTGFQ
jgi:hypothetical protein